MCDKEQQPNNSPVAEHQEEHLHGCTCGHEHHHDCGHEHCDEDGARCISCGAPIGEGTGHNRSMGRPVFAFFGGLLILNSFLLPVLFDNAVFAADLSAAAGAICLALPIVVTAVRDLFQGRVYMNELVALAILAAFTGGDFRTAGIIAFFLLITIIIETHTASGAQRSIEALIRLAPHTAHRVNPDGTETETDVLELKIGDIIAIRPGENFPVDGVVVNGSSAVNQASITGESLPVDKGSNDDVFAGTLNISGGLTVRVTKLGSDTTLGKVKDMILSAERNKTPIVRIIDRYAGYYTPTILMLAAITWWFTDGNMDRVIALLVIACPCAVVLATPTTIVAAVAAAARLGILIKNISHLELAAKIRAVIFDKTGTLTEGELSVARLAPRDGLEPAEFVQIAVSLEAHSNHPTALAIQRLAADVNIAPLAVQNAREEHGKGVTALLNGSVIAVGRAVWLKNNGLEVPEMVDESEGMSVVYVARGKEFLGWIGFKDRIRPVAAETVASLKKLGVTRCAMVTGDRESVAKVVAAQLQIDEVRSDCLPDGKVAYVEEVKKNSIVAVVGDGVNDAPALAAGDMGIAMGAIGSDIAINSASVALMTNDLRRIPLLVHLSRKTNAVMGQNLAFGLLFVLSGIILSVFGIMSPVFAAVLHTVSTLIVIFNSARLVRIGEDMTDAGIVSGGTSHE